jgi:hypothetical protein
MRAKKPRCLARLTIVPVVVLLALSGACGKSSPAPALVASEFGFDNYLGVKLEIIQFARQTAYDRCLADAGYPEAKQVDRGRPYPTTSPFKTTRSQFGLPGEAEARKFGFGHDPGWQAPELVSFDPAYNTAARRCEAQSWHRLESDAQKIVQAYQELGNQLLPYRREVDAHLPADLPGKMFTCITAQGYRVPDRATFLRTPAPQTLDIRFGGLVGASQWTPDPAQHTVQIDTGYAPGHYVPTAAESRLAVAWYRCQQKTGSVDAAMRVAAQIQWEYARQRAAVFARLNPQIERLAQRAERLR